MKTAKFALLRAHGKHTVYKVYDSLQEARAALQEYNKNRAAIKRRNLERQLNWSYGYNTARNKYERARQCANKPTYERVPGELFINSIAV